jgi:hypothetical protein
MYLVFCWSGRPPCIQITFVLPVCSSFGLDATPRLDRPAVSGIKASVTLTEAASEFGVPLGSSRTLTAGELSARGSRNAQLPAVSPPAEGSDGAADAARPPLPSAVTPPADSPDGAACATPSRPLTTLQGSAAAPSPFADPAGPPEQAQRPSRLRPIQDAELRALDESSGHVELAVSRFLPDALKGCRWCGRSLSGRRTVPHAHAPPGLEYMSHEHGCAHASAAIYNRGDPMYACTRLHADCERLD